MGCVSSTPASQEDDAPVKKEKVQDSPVKRTANQPQGAAEKLNHSGSSSKVAGVTTEQSPAPKKAPSPVRGTKTSYLMLGFYLCDVDLKPGCFGAVWKRLLSLPILRGASLVLRRV